MTCPRCGTPAAPAARFCFHCGAGIGAGDRPVAGETERRVVTVLFGDLSDFTSWAEDLDPERVGVVTDRVLASLVRVVGEHGGYVDKLTGDGIMAVFGAPTAHEDDADRAVRAAARMQSVVRRLVAAESGGGRRLGLRVGLNTGEVLAGVQAHLTYTVIGDTVNTAARLSDAAGVGLVVGGRETALATMETASWRALDPVRLKGKRDPVTAYELVGVRPPGASRLGLGDEAPFLGREPEFGPLVATLLEAVDTDTPRVVLVSGDAGVGKTRLAQELSRFAGELPGARVLWGRCTPYGEGRDLAAVADMVRTGCGIVDSDDVEAARDRVDRTVARLERPTSAGPVPAGTAERLRAMLGLEGLVPGLRDAATPGALVGGDHVREAVAALFSSFAAEGPLLLVLDDVHWATPTMLDGVLDIAARQTRGAIMLVVLGRPDMLELRGGRPWWAALPAVEVRTLGPLAEPASERLLRAYLGDRVGDRPAVLDPAVRLALLSRAQGNPFFLAELLHLLIDRGLLRRDAGLWVLDGDALGELAGTLLPAGVQAVLAARIDDLDGATKGVLRGASVLGLTVEPGALQAVGRASGHGRPEVVAAAARTLVDRRLLEPVPDTDGVLRFAHTLVRDVAYAGLAKVERARLHAAAARHAARDGTTGQPVTGAARSSEADATAAGHGQRAVQLAVEMGLARGDPAWRARGTAFAALARLGHAALARDDHRTGQSVLSRALALGDAAYGDPLPAQEVLPVRVAFAEALSATGQLEQAEGQLVGALQGPDDALRAAALLVLGEIRRKRADDDGAREAFVSALTAAGSAGVDRLRGEALRQLGLLDYFAWRLRSAEDRFRQALDLARRVGDSRGAGWALQHLAWSATSRGDYALADATLEQAAEVFADLEDAGGVSWVAGTEGLVRLLQGRLLEARELAGSVIPLGDVMGERWGVASLLVIDALAAAELGDIAAATREADRALARFQEVGDRWGQSLACVAVGVAARAVGDFDRAVQMQDRAFALAAHDQPGVASLALVAGGYAHLDRGDLESAEAAAWRATALLAGLDLEPHMVVGARVLLAQVLRRRGRLTEALAELDAALADDAQPALLFPRRQALAHRAGTLLDLGRAEEALAVAELAVATPSEDVRSQVLALRALGSALAAAGRQEAGCQAVEQALRTARSTGMSAEVRATERLLATLGS